MNKNQFHLARPYPLPPADCSRPEEWNKPLFRLYETLSFSEDKLNSFWQQHTFASMGVGPVQADALSQLAVSRLEWLLQQGRKELSGQFSVAELSALLTCYMDDFLLPADGDEMADLVADYLGVNPSDAHSDDHALFERLRALTVLQRTALFDAMELIFFSGKEPLEVLRELGIELRPTTN